MFTTFVPTLIRAHPGLLCFHGDNNAKKRADSAIAYFQGKLAFPIGLLHALTSFQHLSRGNRHAPAHMVPHREPPLIMPASFLDRFYALGLGDEDAARFVASLRDDPPARCDKLVHLPFAPVAHEYERQL